MRGRRIWVGPAICAALAAFAMADAERAVAQPTVKDVLQQGSKPDPADADQTAPEPPPGVADDLQRETPRRSVEAYLTAVRKGDYETAAEYLDLRRLPKEQIETEGPTLARHLKIVLNRTLWIDLDGLSPTGEGHEQDGLPSYRDLVGRIKGADATHDVLLQHVPRGDGVLIWKFASATVAKIPELYEEFGFGLLGDRLPSVLYDVDIFGYELRYWVALVVAPIVCYLLAALLTGVILFFLRRRVTPLTTQLSRFVGGPLRLVIAVLVLSALRQRASLPLSLGAFVLAIEDTLLILAFAWTALRIADVLWQILINRLIARDQTTVIGVIPAARTTSRILIFLAAFLAILNSFGFNITAVMAGLGVGGIAVALAAQKTFENLIGGVTLFADQPVRVGDFCRVGDMVGTVEQIGLRSTRIRTLDRTLMTIPNAEFSNLHLDNYAKRDKIWFHPRIGLRYETTPDQIRYILVEIRKMLYAHPMVDPDPARIRFVQFGAYSLDLDIFAYVTETDYGKYLEVAEDLNLRIMEIVARAGSAFAFPSQTTYIENGEGMDAARTKSAETEVRTWRTQRALYVPAFPQDEVARLRNTLDYPPRGTPTGAVFEEPTSVDPSAEDV
jgi:MscS family membrane protein